MAQAETRALRAIAEAQLMHELGLHPDAAAEALAAAGASPAAANAIVQRVLDERQAGNGGCQPGIVRASVGIRLQRLPSLRSNRRLLPLHARLNNKI